MATRTALLDASRVILQAGRALEVLGGFVAGAAPLVGETTEVVAGLAREHGGTLLHMHRQLVTLAASVEESARAMSDSE